jgi:predicted amidohydrolase
MFKSKIFIGPGFLYSSARGTKYHSSKRLTNLERNFFLVSPNLHEIIIGTSLDDLNIRKNYANARLNFEQGLINEVYMIHLYDLFKDYCNYPLIIKVRKPDYRTGKVYT